MLSKSNSLFIQSSQPHLDSVMTQHGCEITSRLLIPCCEIDGGTQSACDYEARLTQLSGLALT